MLHFWLIFAVAFYLAPCHASEGDEHYKKYMESLSEGVKCHKGFRALPKRITEAAERCRKQSQMASYMCFVTCVYREYEYIKRDSDEIDFAIADIVTMESFNVDTQDGRDSYWKIALARYLCAKSAIDAGKPLKFAHSYNDAKECARVQEFFQCHWNSLTCNSEKYSSLGIGK